VKNLTETLSSREEVYIDLTNVPLKPVGRKEISQLEIALIIGTLYRPEILELIRDPIERSTWMDSLAVAAAAFARYKAGIPISQIAEELGRSETSIRSHISGKTKAGKLIIETFEKIKSGELRLITPFIKAPIAGVEEELKTLREELSRTKERVRSLEEEVSRLKGENESLKTTLVERDNRIASLEEELRKIREELEKALREKDQISSKYNEILERFKELKEVLERALNIVKEVS
jgi:probable regulatory domain-containing protein